MPCNNPSVTFCLKVYKLIVWNVKMMISWHLSWRIIMKKKKHSIRLLRNLRSSLKQEKKSFNHQLRSYIDSLRNIYKFWLSESSLSLSPPQHQSKEKNGEKNIQAGRYRSDWMFQPLEHSDPASCSSGGVSGHQLFPKTQFIYNQSLNWPLMSRVIRMNQQRW